MATLAVWKPNLGSWTDVDHCRHEMVHVEQGKSEPIVIRLNLLTDSETAAASPHMGKPMIGTSVGPTAKTNAPVKQSTEQALLEIRRRSGLTWELLSTLFNVSRRTIHHWANGKSPSVQHEYQIRRTRDAIRHLDEGAQRTTRDRLLVIENGLSLFELLAESRYDEVMSQVAGAGSVATIGSAVEISEEERERRRPQTPDLLLGALQDRPNIEAKPARILRPARRN